LFDKYKSCFEQSDNVKRLELTAKIYKYQYNWDKALAYYEQSEKISLEVGDKAGLASIYFNIGLVLKKKEKRQWAKTTLSLGDLSLIR
jgi:tetratricopeptide (TPR) repeat protein